MLGSGSVASLLSPRAAATRSTQMAKLTLAIVAQDLVRVADAVNAHDERISALEDLATTPTAAAAAPTARAAKARVGAVKRSKPAAAKPAAPKTAAEIIARTERALADAINGGSDTVTPEKAARRLARLTACVANADTPERALAWYRGTEPMPTEVRPVAPVKLNGTQARAAETARRDGPVHDAALKFTRSWLDALVSISQAEATMPKRTRWLASELHAALIAG